MAVTLIINVRMIEKRPISFSILLCWKLVMGNSLALLSNFLKVFRLLKKVFNNLRSFAKFKIVYFKHLFSLNFCFLIHLPNFNSKRRKIFAQFKKCKLLQHTYLEPFFIEQYFAAFKTLKSIKWVEKRSMLYLSSFFLLCIIYMPLKTTFQSCR